MDNYVALRQNVRCPECAEVMQYREESDDWLCEPCNTEFVFSMGRWWSGEPSISIQRQAMEHLEAD